MNSAEIRQKFLSFFESKGHNIVPSAPMVIKNDPTLMFTNAGMNQFKDIFLGNRKADSSKVTNSQKCLRVSGKHNDLEEVGVDTYHHTMFEMLGNWSFADYFKKEAISWAWELLTEVYGLDKDRLYVSIFEGDKDDNLEADEESGDIWKQFISEDRILRFNKKDNFWEMGDAGPCGPCSEIHVDLRTNEERAKIDGKLLVNNDHPQVIEIWNLVFIQYNRKADGSLEPLPHQHVDTGMGFERLVRAIQCKSSNYDTDVFMQTIIWLEQNFKQQYNYSLTDKKDIAFRVIADHIRAISFAIADGQLPANTGAGYVIRRILRRAVRYGYSYLGATEPFLNELVEVIANQFKGVFDDLYNQKDFVRKVIFEEEKSFLKTLSRGIDLLNVALAKAKTKTLDGAVAFELFDTFGFPIDLTQLIAREKDILLDMNGFESALLQQKERSRNDAAKQSGDWIVLLQDDKEEFVGYDYETTEVLLVKYKEEKIKDKTRYQLVFNITPFYAESGGQVGDSGKIIGKENNEVIFITDTKKENDLIVHYVDKLPENKAQSFVAEINTKKRRLTEANHSATHLLHAALRKTLGTHVVQKGSLVNPDYLRFDFAHFAKLNDEELQAVELMVNEKVRANISLDEKRNVPISKATELGAMALFGEKYGDVVRVITFDSDYSVELCGGTHVKNTSQIGSFKIIAESSVAAGVRRIEAISAAKANEFVQNQLQVLEEANRLLGNPKELVKSIAALMADKVQLQNQLDELNREKLTALKGGLKEEIVSKNGLNVLCKVINGVSAAFVKDLLFQLKNETDNFVAVIAHEFEGKPAVAIMFSETVVASKQWDAAKWIRDLAQHIKGGGGGQAFFATAGGKELSGLNKVIEEANKLITS
jgi:alanyl-tRNA synthetase